MELFHACDANTAFVLVVFTLLALSFHSYLMKRDNNNEHISIRRGLCLFH